MIERCAARQARPAGHPVSVTDECVLWNAAIYHPDRFATTPLLTVKTDVPVARPRVFC